MFRRLNPDSKRLLKEANKDLAKYIFEEQDVNKFFKLLFGHNPGNADSVTTTFSEITEVLNNRNDFGKSDPIFGLYDGNRSSAYMLCIPASWTGTFSDHVRTSMTKLEFSVFPKNDATKCSENLVI